jgi:hypothetical protein
VNSMHQFFRNDETGRMVVAVMLLGDEITSHTAQDDHPNWRAICERLATGDVEGLGELFDIGAGIQRRFEQVTDRVKIEGSTIFYDDEPMHGALARQIMSFVDAGVEDWRPLVAFYENIQANPNAHSREQLYEWLDRDGITITQNGKLIGYKGVASDGKGGYTSLHSGQATVNDVTVAGKIPYAVGDVVTMPRDEVQHDPSVGCHKGLHVGTYEYAQSYSAHGVMLKVVVDPADVVSVPTDCDAAKLRACKLVVVDIIQSKIESPVDDYEDEPLRWDVFYIDAEDFHLPLADQLDGAIHIATYEGRNADDAALAARDNDEEEYYVGGDRLVVVEEGGDVADGEVFEPITAAW